MRNSFGDLIEQEIGCLSGSGRRIQILGTTFGKDPVSSVATDTVFVCETKRVHTKERFSGKAGGNWLRRLYELECLWMGGEKRFYRRRFGCRRIACRQGAEELQKFFSGP